MIAWLAREVGATFPEANRLSRNKTTHLIVGRIAAIGGSTSPAPWEEVSVKEKTAQEWGTACVSETWLELCAARGRLLGDYEAPALFSPPTDCLPHQCSIPAQPAPPARHRTIGPPAAAQSDPQESHRRWKSSSEWPEHTSGLRVNHRESRCRGDGVEHCEGDGVEQLPHVRLGENVDHSGGHSQAVAAGQSLHAADSGHNGNTFKAETRAHNTVANQATASVLGEDSTGIIDQASRKRARRTMSPTSLHDDLKGDVDISTSRSWSDSQAVDQSESPSKRVLKSACEKSSQPRSSTRKQTAKSELPTGESRSNPRDTTARTCAASYSQRTEAGDSIRVEDDDKDGSTGGFVIDPVLQVLSLSYTRPFVFHTRASPKVAASAGFGLRHRLCQRSGVLVRPNP